MTVERTKSISDMTLAADLCEDAVDLSTFSSESRYLLDKMFQPQEDLEQNMLEVVERCLRLLRVKTPSAFLIARRPPQNTLITSPYESTFICMNYRCVPS
jgi:hypothetical protein